MLLQCETAGRDRAAMAAAWLHPGTLESLLELNELCLGLLAEQATTRAAATPLLLEVAGLWGGLDAAGRQRAAACPYLLVDAGFADTLRWRAPSTPQVGDGAAARYAGFFTVPGARPVARLVFIYAWHLARSQPAAARLLLGMSAAAVHLIGRYTLGQIEALGETHPEWLRPRWPACVSAWRELLLAAASGESGALERARLRGLTLLAAEARVASPEGTPCAAFDRPASTRRSAGRVPGVPTLTPAAPSVSLRPRALSPR